MVKTLARKAALIIPILLVVSFGATALIDLIPGSPARIILGDYATPDAIAQANQQYGYDRPVWIRYGLWLGHALHGNLGASIQTQQPVTTELGQFLPVTLELAVLALVISLLIAIPLAIQSAFRPGGVLDRVITAISSVLTAAPVFVSAVVFVFVLSAKFRLLPSTGWTDLTSDPVDNLRHAALPVLTLVATITPLFTRVLRGDLVSVLSENFVLTARARGLPEWYVLFRHVLRPASLSLTTIAGVVFGTLFGGSIIVESFFSLPGLGQLVSQAVFVKDVPVIQGVVVVIAFVFLLINLGVDLAYAVIDPRVRVR
jgi:peptide/nickel transport system permease protein